MLRHLKFLFTGIVIYTISITINLSLDFFIQPTTLLWYFIGWALFISVMYLAGRGFHNILKG